MITNLQMELFEALTNIHCILSTRLLALAGPGLQLGGAQAAAVLTVGRVRAGGQSNRHPRAIKEAVKLCKICIQWELGDH